MTKQVKCVVGVSQINITKDKIYDVIEENYVCYKITNDSGKTGFFNKGFFEEFEQRKFVKCVSKHPNYPNLTINKIYEVINEYTYNYSIVNDNGKESLYSKNIFDEIFYLDINNGIVESNVFKIDSTDESNKMPKYIRCIDNKNYEDCLTLNKIYEVNHNFDNLFAYFIMNDKNGIYSYYKDRFVEVDNIEKASLYRDNIHQTQKYKFVPESDITEVIVDGIKGVLIKE